MELTLGIYSERKKSAKLKFSFHEQREFDTIDEVIENLENRISVLEDEIQAAGSDFEKLAKLLKEKEELDDLLLEKMERWEYLNELHERIQRGDTD